MLNSDVHLHVIATKHMRSEKGLDVTQPPIVVARDQISSGPKKFYLSCTKGTKTPLMCRPVDDNKKRTRKSKKKRKKEPLPRRRHGDQTTTNVSAASLCKEFQQIRRNLAWMQNAVDDLSNWVKKSEGSKPYNETLKSKVSQINEHIRDVTHIVSEIFQSFSSNETSSMGISYHDNQNLSIKQNLSKNLNVTQRIDTKDFLNGSHRTLGKYSKEGTSIPYNQTSSRMETFAQPMNAVSGNESNGESTFWYKFSFPRILKIRLKTLKRYF